MAVETLADSDRQLVERALAGHEEAFAAIVRRHGPMVYRVCWRVLQHAQDAEDAFQAAFLVLAQKLRSLRKHASLASWLHGVALRVAHRTRSQTAAVRRRERQASLPEVVPPDHALWCELRGALDVELSRLPDERRLPLILCYLEGRTQDEAAGQLGWSKSTLRRRLEEARDILAIRLKRRGITVPAALSAVLLSNCLASPAPRATLVALTMRAMAGVAAGTTVNAGVPPLVAGLAEGVLKAMLLNKLVKVAALLLALIGLGLATAPFSVVAQSENQPEVATAEARPQTASKKGTRLVVVALLEDEGQRRQLLISVDPGTGTWKKLSGEDVHHPRVSPDGQTVIFHRDDAIWNCDTGGSDNPGKIAVYAAPKVEVVGAPV
jgi:RNA polymerase sigma factor (sigma-70 family)